MKRVVFLNIILLIFCYLICAKGTYELTKVDIFSLKKNLSGSDITIYGVSVNTPMAEILKKFKKNKGDIKLSGNYEFLEVEPGFKVRFLNDQTEALLVDNRFRSKLKGATEKVFDNINTENQFKNYVTRYFLKPDKYNSKSVAGFENNEIVYINGFKFMRFHSSEDTTLVIVFKDIFFK
jgi:hypothetical protein